MEEVPAGVAELARLGLEAVYDESVFDKDRFVAGSVETRVRAILTAWEDPSIAALIAMRGGYGSAQLLPFLDPDVMVSARKALIGYSDITAILCAVPAARADGDPRTDDRSADLEGAVRLRRGFVPQGDDVGRPGGRAASRRSSKHCMTERRRASLPAAR